jgi:Rrf2 family protein
MREGCKATLIQDIAERQNIPVKFLQQILVALKVAGFLQSRKGPGGGYVLAKPPEEIILGDVIRSMDGAIAPISCVSVNNFQECGCPNPETCVLRLKFREVRDAMAAILDSTTFAELRDLQYAVNGQPSILDYVI